MNPTFVILPFYFIVWLASVIRYRSYYDTVLKYFPIFLMYTLLTELLGFLVKYHDSFQLVSDDRYYWYNIIIYNIYSVVTYLYFFYIYLKVLGTEKYKKWVKLGATISMAGYLISLFFQDPFYTGLFYADSIASCFLIMCVLLYFKEKFKQEIYPTWHNLMFWTSLGLLGFHIYFPIYSLLSYLIPSTYFDFHLRGWLIGFIFFMYGSFLIGILIHRRKLFQ
ncbi:hypothetical protein J0X14_06225 [Muricauda sp. CAU 1633]|uniref:hypothetical protein n=1 Tax=Allomuricauda sp. CAU 1633 TaxID=2816036 RepID=UPI001A8DD551|nr:hypothetical protein [Muricauda sp. CAU 1633]MBO0321884.1 hypothetical protein [Muricauda sp. CAU 1633]